MGFCHTLFLRVVLSFLTVATDVVEVPGAMDSGNEQTDTKVTKNCPGCVCITDVANYNLFSARSL